MVTQDDALSLLNKYAEEKTSVLAVLVIPSLSVARLVGTIRVSIVAGVPYLLAGKEESKSDQIKFRLSDCMFEYGAFREEPADKFEAFLVVGSIRRYPIPFRAERLKGGFITRNIDALQKILPSLSQEDHCQRGLLVVFWSYCALC